MLNPNRTNTASGGGSGTMPTIAYIDTATTAGDDTTITFNHWGSIADGHTIILIVFNEGDIIQQYNTQPWRRPTDFTYIDESPGATSMGIDIGAFYKVAVAETDTGTVSVDTDQNGELCGWYIVLADVDTGDVLNGSSTPSWDTGSDSTLVLNELTTDEANCLVFGIAAFDGADSGIKWDWSNSGWAFEDNTANGVNNAFSIAASFALKQQVSAGATGDLTVNTGIVDGPCGFQFAIRGAP